MAAADEEPSNALTELSKEIKSWTTKLSDLDPSTLRKWEWKGEALSIVTELRSLAKDNYPFLRSRLDQALEFPDKESTDPNLFMGGKAGFETFTRTETWFSEMGFNKFTIPYTFSDSWDCSPINATFLVPQDLDVVKCVNIVFFFHGGGFCTGAGNFVSWYSKSSVEFAKANNAIIIAPDYPLGPEASYLQISESIKELLIWYKENGQVRTGTAMEPWTNWLKDIAGLPKLEIDPTKNGILVEGESAGGHAAVTAMFFNAETRFAYSKPWATNLPIKAVFLRYPMIKHYSRELGTSASFMGHDFNKLAIQQKARDIKAAVTELDRLGLTPTRSWDHPPHGMAGAFLLSITNEWKDMFQRHREQGDIIDATMDGLERVVAYEGKVDSNFLPPVIVYHGNADLNCPLTDTQIFCRLLEKHYPEQYRDGETLFFETVTEIQANPTWNEETKKLEDKHVAGVGHGFDYDLDIRRERFLQNAYGNIGKFWGSV